MRSKPSAWQSPAVVNNYLTAVKSAVPLNSSQIETMLRLVDANGKRVKTFLDLGCGDGFLSSIMLSRYKGCRGVLLDYSETMLEAARKKLRRFGRRVKIINGDLGKKGWARDAAAGGPFDAVVSRYAIHHQPDKKKKAIYGHVYRLLRKGGIFVNVEHVASSGKWGERAGDECFIDSLYLNRAVKAEGRKEIADRFYRRPDKKENILAPVWEQCKWLRKAGFKDADCFFKIFELAVFAGRKR